ncbi:hypothetical protein KL864_32995 [Mycolicibacterium goodii]|uniref:hypothetical protein n=1 Tax=Mycolicibacterium TaxID=1866885 RepID=UPI001BDD95AF|nr:hypothetical protein [Mycolicibacterium goodii]MBU8820687.1 hypothetical protein [Mycolicibacterium goodii]
MQSTMILADPTALTPARSAVPRTWRAGAGNDDPAVVACRAALSYWRTRPRH